MLTHEADMLIAGVVQTKGLILRFRGDQAELAPLIEAGEDLLSRIRLASPADMPALQSLAKELQAWHMSVHRATKGGR